MSFFAMMLLICKKAIEGKSIPKQIFKATTGFTKGEAYNKATITIL